LFTPRNIGGDEYTREINLAPVQIGERVHPRGKCLRLQHLQQSCLAASAWADNNGMTAVDQALVL
jgi:hypothetical protein